MNDINFKKIINGDFEHSISELTEALKKEGFGILTRINLHEKFKEKLGKEMRPVVILGACNPQLAYDAFQLNTDVTSMLPCNAVVRDLGQNKISIELASPSFMMNMIHDKKLSVMASEADEKLKRVLHSMDEGHALENRTLQNNSGNRKINNEPSDVH